MVSRVVLDTYAAKRPRRAKAANSPDIRASGLSNKARRQSLLASTKSSEQDFLAFIDKTADLGEIGRNVFRAILHLGPTVVRGISVNAFLVAMPIKRKPCLSRNTRTLFTFALKSSPIKDVIGGLVLIRAQGKRLATTIVVDNVGKIMYDE